MVRSLFTLSIMTAALVSLPACTKKPADNANNTSTDSTETRTDVQSNTITVYSARKEQLIKPLLDTFSTETGIKVKLVSDKAAPLMERLKAEGKNSPADLLLTVDAGNLWQAGQQGLLQPIQSEALEKQVPENLRDPENQWFGMSIRARTVFYNPKTVKPESIVSYENLASPAFKGKLCLRTSKKVYNQSLVAMMIAHYGEEKTESIVKGWVANLATDVFTNDTKLLKAIAAGQCQVGIANSYYYGRVVKKDPAFPVKIYWPNQKTTGVHVNVSGAGVTKYAPNPMKAVQLMEWLSAPQAQAIYSADDSEYPVNPEVKPAEMLQSWGEFKADTINVSEAGKLQADAVKLMDRAGYL